VTRPDLKPELERLVMKALETPYSSFSATDDSETGNRYQAVGLGDRSTRGLREDRSRFLDVLDLRARTVLDLGSNLGEISRAARARGAALVDGFEIDPYFNEIAHLVNMLTGTTRVSLYERDMADPAAFTEPYDVVLAFSAFRFIAGLLDRIAAITSVLVVETHELKGNFDERYLLPLTSHFPAYRMLGESDVERLRAGGVRAVGVFAHDEEALLSALAPDLRDGPAAGALTAGVRAQRIRGEVHELRFDGSRVRIGGWCRPRTGPDAVELSTPAHGPAGVPFGTLGVTEPRPDGGFELDCEAPLHDADPVRFDVSAFAADMPLGTLSAYWAADVPPAQLPGLTVAHDLLEPLGRYRALDSFESVLDVSRSPELLQPFLRSLLPGADVAREADGAAFDLVMGHDVDPQQAGVETWYRATQPGAYLAFSFLGELARSSGEAGRGRDDVIGLCAARFAVITYVEGGVAGLHDLIVLRRP
jgi:SAM-dependent methyltransferase